MDRPKPRPKWLDDNYNKVGKSKKHEERLAKQLGGYRLPRSGGLPYSEYDPTSAGGDLTTDDFLFEHKSTEKKSLSVKRDWLEKVSDGAAAKGLDPGLIITFEDPKEDWVCVPLAVFERIMGKINE